jgi:hypothetical protein
MLLGGSLAAACFVAAVLVDGFNLFGRLLAVGAGLAGVAFAYWVYRQQRWRLALYPGGLVQVRAWGIDEVAWSQVREVVETRVKGSASSYKLTVVAAAGNLVVQPINYRRPQQLFDLLLEAARARQIAVRTEWVEFGGD